MHYNFRLKSSLAVATILVLIINCYEISSTDDDKQASSSNQHDHSEVAPSSDELQIGPFLVNRTYSQRNYRDRLRLSKCSTKYQFKTALTGDMSLLDYKINIREHLLRCDNLSLLDYALKSEFDCQPIESYLPSYIDIGALPPSSPSPSLSSKATTSNAEYVKRITIKKKLRFLDDIQVRQENTLYPLKNEHTELKIGSILEENNLTSPLNFANPVNLGYQLEINYFASSKSEKHLTCSGQLYLSANASKPLLSDRLPDETYPEIMKKYEDFIGEAIDNGYLLAVRNLSCYQPLGLMSFVKFKTNFDVIHKNEFPYFTLSHSSWLEPMRAMFDYKAVINQTKDSVSSKNSDDTLSHNTTIRINSSSAISSLLNFDLKQTNSNNLRKNFSESMVAFSKHFALIVEAKKNETLFYKLAKLFLFNLDKMKSSKTAHEVDRSVLIVFSDEKDDDELSLTLKLRRDLANSLLGYPLDPSQQTGESRGEDNDERAENFRVEL